MRSRPPHILVACQPKSGSTFLSRALAALPGMRCVQLTPGYARREQELCESLLSRNRRKAYVAQHHVRWSVVTDELVRRFDLRVVVLVRDLFDAVISLRDHVRRESGAFPMAYLDEGHRALPDAELEAMIVRLAIPWYVNFYMCWRNFPDATLVRYKDLAARPAETIRRIAEGARLDPTDSQIVQAIDQARQSRFNRGIVGRGASLAPRERESILQMLRFYPEAANDPYFREMLEGRPASGVSTAPALRERPSAA
jgi:hypothetical protein